MGADWEGILGADGGNLASAYEDSVYDAEMLLRSDRAPEPAATAQGTSGEPHLGEADDGEHSDQRLDTPIDPAEATETAMKYGLQPEEVDAFLRLRREVAHERSTCAQIAADFPSALFLTVEWVFHEAVPELDKDPATTWEGDLLDAEGGSILWSAMMARLSEEDKVSIQEFRDEGEVEHDLKQWFASEYLDPDEFVDQYRINIPEATTFDVGEEALARLRGGMASEREPSDSTL